MEWDDTVRDVIEDLKRVAASGPNERLPKEEQIRSRLFASLQADCAVVCAERGYRPVESRSRAECDLWARYSDGRQLWLELKVGWAIEGWVNKPVEQVNAWKADIQKLEHAEGLGDRVFFLVAFLATDPAGPFPRKGHLLEWIEKFSRDHRDRLHYKTASPFHWRNEAISHVGVWVWLWKV